MPAPGPHLIPYRCAYGVAEVVAGAKRLYEEAVREDAEAALGSIADAPAGGLVFLAEAVRQLGPSGRTPAYAFVRIGPERPPRLPEHAGKKWGGRTHGPMTLPSSGEGLPRQSIEITEFRDVEDGDGLRRWTYDTFVNAWNKEGRVSRRYGPSRSKVDAKEANLQQALKAASSGATQTVERDCVACLAAYIAADFALRSGMPPSEVVGKRDNAYSDKAYLITDVVAYAVKSELDAGTLVLSDFAGERTRSRDGEVEPVLTWESFYDFACVFTEAECGVSDRDAVTRALTATGILEECDCRPPTDRIRSTIERLVKHADKWARQPYGYGPAPQWAETRKTRRPR